MDIPGFERHEGDQHVRINLLDNLSGLHAGLFDTDTATRIVQHRERDDRAAAIVAGVAAAWCRQPEARRRHDIESAAVPGQAPEGKSEGFLRLPGRNGCLLWTRR